MNYVITRPLCLRYERAITLDCSHGPTVQVDPQQCVHAVTGEWLSRDYCIVSFAHGLHDAGHAVRVQMRHKGRVFPSQTMPPRLIGVPAYFFVGYAWGCGVWSELASSMIQYIVPEKRWEVFDCTANAYFCGKLGKPYWIL